MPLSRPAAGGESCKAGFFLISCKFLQHFLSPAVRLGHIVVIFQNHKIRIVSCADFSLPVVHAQASGRVDGAGVERIVKWNHGLLHQDLKPSVHMEGTSGDGVRALQIGKALPADLDVMAAKLVLSSRRQCLARRESVIIMAKSRPFS